MNKKFKICAFIMLIFNLVMSYFLFTTSETSIISTGGIIPIESKVTIKGGIKPKGTINSVYVTSLDRPTKFNSFVYSLNKDIEVTEFSPSEELLSSSQLLESSRISFETGLTDSVIASYKAAEKEIEYSLDYMYLSYLNLGNVETDLRIGDKIVEVNSKKFTTNEEFNTLVKSIISNDPYATITFTLQNGEAKTSKKISEEGGLYFTPSYKVDSSEPQFYVVDSSGYGGSGGLLQSIGLYIELSGEDLTKGRVIAGTGTMEIDGTVGPIGGIKQKVITCIKSGVDVFLCPSVHYEEALETFNEYDTDMLLVSVSTLKEAVEYLYE